MPFSVHQYEEEHYNKERFIVTIKTSTCDQLDNRVNVKRVTLHFNLQLFLNLNLCILQI